MSPWFNCTFADNHPSTTPAPEEVSSSSASKNLAFDASVFGGVSAGLFVLFCLIRKRFPNLYNPRNSFPSNGLYCDLAARSYGMFGWVGGVLGQSEEEMFAQCGFDNVSFLRILNLGFKVSLLGCFNAVWLIPAYESAAFKTINQEVTDGFDQLSIAKVYANDNRMYGSAIAAYMQSFLCMYLLWEDFKWYIKRRHREMGLPTPQNYTIYVGGIPPELRSKIALGQYFESLFPNQILEINFALNIQDIEKDLAVLDKVKPKLEHANALLAEKSKDPTHGTHTWAPALPGLPHGPAHCERPQHRNRSGNMVDTIETYTEEKRTVEDRINKRFDEVEKEANEHEAKMEMLLPSIEAEEMEAVQEESQMNLSGRGGISKIGGKMTGAMTGAMGGVMSVSKNIIPVGGTKELLRDGAFVSFTTLQASTSALQLLHHRTPFNVWGAVAPSPTSVFWKNIGLPHFRVQLTSLLAGVFTVATCVLWTLPVTFIASLKKVDSLKAELPFLRTAADAFPQLDTLLGLISPIALVVLTNMLPSILGLFCQMEGHIGEDVLQASLFKKLTLFMIIQVFFVSALAGSIFDQVEELAKDPANKLITILATSLPGQAVVFMSYTIVKCFLEMMLELLRVVPAITSTIHTHMAPQLTEKEKRSAWMGIRPLCDPGSLDLAYPLAKAILLFIILFVYAVLAPIAAFVMAAGFFLQMVVYRYQFAFVYDPSNDTDGKLWPKAAGYVVVCMLISQVTVLGVIGLKEGKMAPIMFPLIVFSILFWRYLSQQHFRVAATLPMPDCIRKDRAAKSNQLDLEFVKGKYRQQALRKVGEENLDEEARALPAAKPGSSLVAVAAAAPAAAASSTEQATLSTPGPPPGFPAYITHPMQTSWPPPFAHPSPHSAMPASSLFYHPSTLPFFGVVPSPEGSMAIPPMMRVEAEMAARMSPGPA